ncbi:hypothetical protein XENTR_v10016253 [Xenopus tropicalis]|nr:hypothetical protein XENTR_v10016253 [Xenopus tropicalis]
MYIPAFILTNCNNNSTEYSLQFIKVTVDGSWLPHIPFTTLYHVFSQLILKYICLVYLRSHTAECRDTIGPVLLNPNKFEG